MRLHTQLTKHNLTRNHIILYCSLLLFPQLLRKDFVVLRGVLKAVVRVCGELVEIIINTVVDKHPKSCKLPAGDILLDTNHLFHIYIYFSLYIFW